jgi:hypothetical protein
MANQPNKKDPTETALSAVQEALAATDNRTAATRNVRVPADPIAPEAPGRRTAPAVETDLFDGLAVDDPAAARRAANDDRQ